MNIPDITLNNHTSIPQVGLGTFLIPQTILTSTLEKAISLGYRHFDTAWRYGNEKIIGDFVRNCGIDRKELFITTKVNVDSLYWFGWYEGKHRIFNFRKKSIKSAIEESFKNLGVDYVDLFLVHYPWPHMVKMYKALEHFYHEGRIKAIGVCTSLPPHLDLLSKVSDVVPAVNQFEISPLNSQKALIRYCQERGIAVEAMSVFSHFRSNEPRLEIIEHPVLCEIGKKYNKPATSVILRWLLQQNVIVIPKTWDYTHLKENIQLFDFALSEADMNLIDSLDKGKFLNYDPYKSLKHLPDPYGNWNGFNTAPDDSIKP